LLFDDESDFIRCACLFSMFVHIHVDPNSKTAKAIGMIGIPMFAAFLYFQTIDFMRASDSRSWPAVDGIILVSQVERAGLLEPSPANVKYRTR